MAVDDNDMVHVVWEDLHDTENIWYAYRMSADNWILEEATDGGINYYAHIALDSDNKPHILWRDYDVSWGCVRYANKTGISWSSPETVSADYPELLLVWNRPQIALDDDDNIWAVWSEWDSIGEDSMADLHVRKRTSGVWSADTKITDQEDYDYIRPSVLWSRYPNIEGTRTNVISGDQYVVFEAPMFNIWFIKASVAGAKERSHAYIVG
jgi:hypothetical protein